MIKNKYSFSVKRRDIYFPTITKNRQLVLTEQNCFT